MDSLKKLDVKGKRVRVTDDSSCRYVGTVEYVDYLRGKLGITGAVEGSQGTKSLQIFFRSDIKKIVVFDDNPTVFDQIPTQPSMLKTTIAANIKQPSSPSYLLMPAGAEYRGGKYKITTRIVQHNMGSVGSFPANNMALVYLSYWTRSTSDMFHDLHATDIAATVFKESLGGQVDGVTTSIRMVDTARYWRFRDSGSSSSRPKMA